MSKFEIKSIKAMQVYDSRGRPTIETTVTLTDDTSASAIVPSGASVGSMEAMELRDGDKPYSTVHRAIENVNVKISKYLLGLDCRSQTEIDEIMIELDGTTNKSMLGGNAILSVSLALSKVAASASQMQLYNYLGGMMANTIPVPMMNFINGGVHADNALDIQEFMIMPVSCESFADCMQMGSKILHTLKDLLKTKRMSTNVGDEGGFAIEVNSSEVALDLLMAAIEKAGFVPGQDVLLAMDVAASELFEGDSYYFKGEGEKMRIDRLVQYYKNLILNYPIFSIEDPVSEKDHSGFKKITQNLGDLVQLVGDDTFTTNHSTLQEGINQGIANAILIKPNQVGTITETIDTIQLAKSNGYETIASHRSGETEDVSIAHIAVGCGTSQIKTGSVMRTDRVAKYNELLRIEQALGKNAMFAGEIVINKYNKRRSNLLKS